AHPRDRQTQQRRALLVCTDGVSESGRWHLIPALRRLSKERIQHQECPRDTEGDRQSPQGGVYVGVNRGSKGGNNRLVRRQGSRTAVVLQSLIRTTSTKPPTAAKERI